MERIILPAGVVRAGGQAALPAAVAPPAGVNLPNASLKSGLLPGR